MQKIAADWIFPITSTPIEKGLLILDDNSRILEISNLREHDSASVQYLPGVLIPGFINAHCHLELSHMKDKVDTGTGLLPFLQSVVAFRDFPEEVILDAIEKSDEAMQAEGIVAVGDISNKLDTAAQKAKSPIRYYTFVELFDFLQDDLAEETFQKHQAVLEGQSAEGGDKKSYAPHAPYTVSKKLFQQIRAANPRGASTSIHNQETAHENALFESKSGGFLDFYKAFGFSLEHFEPTGNPSIHYALQQMDPNGKTLFVHNTQTTPEDIKAAHAWSDHTYWVTCPNANLYIENRIPNYQYFLDTNAHVAIGTDSLTSNWQLSILEEMKTIARYQSYVPLETLFRWATYHGALALGFENDLGSFEVGKKPGVLHLNLDKDLKLDAGVQVQRLA